MVSDVAVYSLPIEIAAGLLGFLDCWKHFSIENDITSVLRPSSQGIEMYSICVRSSAISQEEFDEDAKGADIDLRIIEA